MRKLPVPSLLSGAPPLALAGALLSGCLFTGDEKTSFRVGFHGSLDTLHAYEGDVATQVLGVGVEIRNLPEATPEAPADEDFISLYDGNTLALFPEAKDPWAWKRGSQDSVVLDAIVDAFDPDYRPQRMLVIRRDSAAMGMLTPGLLFAQFELERRYKGMPCAFSNFEGEVWDSTRPAGLPLVVKSLEFRRTGSVLRVSARIDTAASRIKSPNADFSQEIYVSMRVTCP